jgi:hypothetical protein
MQNHPPCDANPGISKDNAPTDKQPRLLTPHPLYHPPRTPRQHPPTHPSLGNSITFKTRPSPYQRTVPPRHVMKDLDVRFTPMDNSMQVSVEGEQKSGCAVGGGKSRHGELHLYARLVDKVCYSRNSNVLCKPNS